MISNQADDDAGVVDGADRPEACDVPAPRYVGPPSSILSTMTSNHVSAMTS